VHTTHTLTHSPTHTTHYTTLICNYICGLLITFLIIYTVFHYVSIMRLTTEVPIQSVVMYITQEMEVMTNLVETEFNMQACNGMSLAKLNCDGLKLTNGP